MMARLALTPPEVWRSVPVKSTSAESPAMRMVTRMFTGVSLKPSLSSASAKV